MNKQELTDLVRRLRDGTASPEEKNQLEQFWQEAMNDTSHLDSMPETERAALKSEILKATRAEIERIAEQSRQRTRRVRAWRIAAAFALLAAASAVLYWNTARYAEIHTGYGERLVVLLPDGSNVTLNGNSTLRYRKAWDDEHAREVWIEGEGFFAVQHTSDHQKFVVHARKGVELEVLGTKFNVKSRQHQTEVMLTEGRVKVDLQTKREGVGAVFLAPGELVTANEHHLSKRTVKKEPYTSWLTNTLVFDHTTLREIAIMLKDTYGLNVAFSELTLQDRQLSGEISSATTEDILNAIAQTFDLNIDRHGDTVYISSK